LPKNKKITLTPTKHHHRPKQVLPRPNVERTLKAGKKKARAAAASESLGFA
jgi:hypothetical protein